METACRPNGAGGSKKSRKDRMRIFQKMGIPGPEPNFLFGNLLEFQKVPLYKKHQEWKQKYGTTYGYYEGPTPVLVTSDVNILEEVFVKQFNNFHARKLWPVQVDPDKDEDVHMFFARGRRWKRLRGVVNPAFSAAKIRKMTPTLNECINHLLDVMRDTANKTSHKTVELLDIFRRLTLDTILRCEVGIDQNSLKNPDDPILNHCKGVINDTVKTPWLYLLGFLFPSLHCVWITLYKFLHNIKCNSAFWLEDRMREVVSMRRILTNEHRNDLMQQMLDAQFTSDSVQDLEKEASKISNPYKKFLKSMTNEEIVSHALLFLLAGYETTSTTLAYLFFELSQNPHVQQRLRLEIMAVLPRGYHTIEYDDLKQLTYLDYVIWETLRKYPLASTVTARQCMRDCTVGNMQIPMGMLVHANLWDVHYDPTHWGEDPQAFNPLRFMPEQRRKRHATAWMPFGGGPRACAGIRFALLQLKMVVSKVLRDFDFYPSDKLIVPLPLKQGATILPAEGVHLSARRRGSALSEAGLRRGSVMTGIPLADWIGMRRKSLREEDFGCEISPLEHSDNNSRKASLTENLLKRNDTVTIRCNSKENRRNSLLENQLTSEAKSHMRRASVIKGIELLTKDSVGRGLKLTAINFDTKNYKHNLFNLRDVYFNGQPDIDNTMGISTMPEELLGEMPHLKSKSVLRRGSAVPDLESVNEIELIESFKPREKSFILENTMDVFDEIDVMKKSNYTSERLHKRRGSG
ncbi:cytochrome P450 3A43-like isoform X1 [Biomphalaria pfeifferi]|uniref:Cytochrome P450 3A43-like isoform X1 n=1 Tax=Biomphalaria pfeifferi TaxID=112525 RepID=A0AAD8FA43_BIOPF|nr:cytochrome P450 3A43-like isoform X1 [Biomphalaria pfeifferi]